MCKCCDLCWQRDISPGRASGAVLPNSLGTSWRTGQPFSPFFKGFFKLPSRAVQTVPGVPVHRALREQHPCAHTLPLPPPSLSHREHHRPAVTDRLITFCPPEPALWSSGNREPSPPRPPRPNNGVPPRRPSGWQSPAAGVGRALAGGSRAAPDPRPPPGGPGQAREHPSDDRRLRLPGAPRSPAAPALLAPPEAGDAAAGEGVPGAGPRGVSSPSPPVPLPPAPAE